MDEPRTLLFAPADNARTCKKAWVAGADAVIFDLEDAVAPARKAAAREHLARLLAELEPGPQVIVRVNAPATSAGADDLAALAAGGLHADAVMVPKAEPAALAALADAVGPAAPPLVALVETAVGVLHAEQVAAAPGVARLMLGPVDLAAELGCEPEPRGQELLLARSALVLASAAAGIAAPIDGPCLALDAEVVRAEAEQARRLGFGAKACIHPRQLDAVRDAFMPTAEQVATAMRTVEAYETALARGEGVVALDGQMIDVPVARRAQAILRRSGAKG